MTRQLKWVASATIAALLMSGCAGTGASAHDRDIKACKELATWITNGQGPDEYPELMVDVMTEAQDTILRGELDELREVRVSGSQEEWAEQLDIVAYRCLELYEKDGEEL